MFGDQAAQVIHLPDLLVELVQLLLESLVLLPQVVKIFHQHVVVFSLVVIRLLHHLLQYH